ncbi:MAG: NAD(P)/FAD-dependent oxidoreductase [Steroidobacteraceae bacterium]
MQTVDVVIAGGGAVGSAIAYFLSHQSAFSGSLAVVEPDPTYTFAASARSASSIRQQFSTPLNIALSAFGMEFLRARGIAGSRDLGDVGLHEATYLLLASAAGAEVLAGHVEIQRRCGVRAHLYDATALASRYPWINASDLKAAADTEQGEGWFDGYALLRALRLASERRGVRYLRDRVVSLLMRSADLVDGVRLGGGDTLRCRWLVNAAGTRSRDLASHAGIDVPVYPRKRTVFVFRSPAAISNCPLVVDTTGLWFRPEGDGFLCGPAPGADPNVEPDDFEVEHRLFEEIAWPALAHRVPAFESARVSSAWVGHYDYNVFDQNAFVGPCEAVPNFLLACGFSGHGLQQAPGIGRALAELITFGEYRTIDVAAFAHARYTRAQPLRELNVI